MERKIQFIDAEKIQEVKATNLQQMLEPIEDATLGWIMSAAIGTAAGQCVRSHWDTDEEQNLFNHLSQIMRRSSMVTNQ